MESRCGRRGTLGDGDQDPSLARVRPVSELAALSPVSNGGHRTGMRTREVVPKRLARVLAEWDDEPEDDGNQQRKARGHPQTPKPPSRERDEAAGSQHPSLDRPHAHAVDDRPQPLRNEHDHTRKHSEHSRNDEQFDQQRHRRSRAISLRARRGTGQPLIHGVPREGARRSLPSRPSRTMALRAVRLRFASDRGLGVAKGPSGYGRCGGGEQQPLRQGICFGQQVFRPEMRTIRSLLMYR